MLYSFRLETLWTADRPRCCRPVFWIMVRVVFGGVHKMRPVQWTMRDEACVPCASVVVQYSAIQPVLRVESSPARNATYAKLVV